MAEFERRQLGDVLGKRGYIRGPFGSALVRSELLDHGIPVYEQQHAITGMRNFRFFINGDKLNELSRFRVMPNDLIISCSGTVGRVSVIQPTDPLGIISQALLILRPQTDQILPKFLYYFLSTSDGQNALVQASHGSVQVNIAPRNIVVQIRVPIPSIPEQRAIAHILGTLDDKIELNLRMNETLEAMARALFKSWFVDFDPVRAKAEGRNPGLPKPIADLFPDSFEESELGEIPRGWRVGTVESLCDSITSGGTPARMNPLFWDDGRIPWFKTGELLDGPLIESEEHITEAALAGSSCKLWPAGTILFALYASPTVGRLGVLTRPGTSNQAAAGLIARPEFGVPFVRRLLLEARVKLQSIAVGAAQQNINQGVLKAHRAVISTENAASTYSRLVSVLDKRQVTLSREANSLAALRDTLLPKLISGELRVKDAKKRIEETG